jgi:hypothetical protein
MLLLLPILMLRPEGVAAVAADQVYCSAAAADRLARLRDTCGASNTDAAAAVAAAAEAEAAVASAAAAAAAAAAAGKELAMWG